MRIVFFNFVTNYGGAARSEVYLAQRLRDAGHDPIFVEPYGSSQAYGEAIRSAGLEHCVLTPTDCGRVIGGRGGRRIVNILNSLPDLTAIRKSANRTIHALNPDIICCQDFKALTVVASISRLKHIPVTMYLREWYTPEMVPRIGRHLWQRRCTGLIAVSHATRAAVYCSGVPWNKIHVLQNPIDVDEHILRSENPLTEELPHRVRTTKMVLPAFIQERKQQHVAVQAAKHLRDWGVDFVLWMAGGIGIPDPANQKYLDYCKQMTVDLDLNDHVFWLDYRDDVPQIMRVADIVLQPSRREGHPRVMLEAMALSKVYVAVPIAGHIEMLLPKLTGMLHELGDNRGLADTVLWLKNHPDEVQQIGCNAQNYVRRSHRPESHTERAIEIFRHFTT